MRYLLILTSILFIGLLAAPAGVLAQDAPEQIQAAIDDLNARLETQLTLNDLTSYTYEGQQFNDASLGCPQEGESYAQALTPGYQFTLVYEGQQYDYRVSEDSSTVILCETQPVTEDSAPVEPVVYQMDQPIVAVAPLSGTPGTTVQLVANGLPANAQVIVGIGRVGSEYDVVETLQTSDEGALATEVDMPDYFETGERVVLVVETADNRLRVVSFPFTVTSDDEVAVPMGDPQVTLSSLTGAPGSAVQMTATGFPPNASVLIGVGPQDAPEFVYSLQEITDAQGSLSMEISIPADAEIDRPYVVLVELESDRDYEATSPAFIPTGSAAAPAPEGEEFTQANIYLIAPGDGGQSGILVGCDDSAVPVQVNFEPTAAPLTATLEQLLMLNTQTYGESGLYNALYLSSLAVAGIDIENRVATINLTGDLQIGGTCDAPRVEAQIRQTALQFNTIDSANIMINGEPIENLLSGQ